MASTIIDGLNAEILYFFHRLSGQTCSTFIKPSRLNGKKLKLPRQKRRKSCRRNTSIGLDIFSERRTRVECRLNKRVRLVSKICTIFFFGCIINMCVFSKFIVVFTWIIIIFFFSTNRRRS